MPGEGHILNMIQVMRANRELAKQRKSAKTLLKDIDDTTSTKLNYKTATKEELEAFRKQLALEKKKESNKKILVLTIALILAVLFFVIITWWVKWILTPSPTL